MSIQPASPLKVANRLIKLREAMGLSKAEFSDRIGIDRSSYTKIEKGEKPILPKDAQHIFALWGVDMNYIYLGRVDGLPSHLSAIITRNLTDQ